MRTEKSMFPSTRAVANMHKGRRFERTDEVQHYIKSDLVKNGVFDDMLIYYVYDLVELQELHFVRNTLLQVQGNL
jgi:hypothetical protein